MVEKRITMQDIADACGLSRNTVSKVFNGRGAVPETSRRMVLQKARELGYRMVPTSQIAPLAEHTKKIALLTSHMPADYHFGASFIPAFAEYLSRAGFTLVMYEVSPDELRQRALPPQMLPEQTAGILTIELFDRGYLEMLCGLGLPLILMDAWAGACTVLKNCDFISMENISSTMALTARVIEKGAVQVGFVGDPEHCNSFYERWIGFRAVLDNVGLLLNKAQCILASDSEPYGDEEWLLRRLREMPALPYAFVCANDFLALHLMTALKRMGLAIPSDVMVTGFDGIPLAAVMDPPLTTVQIPNADIGRMAASLLLRRIENPNCPFSSTYVTTMPVWRGSVR